MATVKEGKREGISDRTLGGPGTETPVKVGKIDLSTQKSADLFDMRSLL